MGMDRRKNSRSRHEPMPLDPPEQRNADRVALEAVGAQVISRLEAVNDLLNNVHLPDPSLTRLRAERQALKDNAVGILAQLVNL